MFEYAFLQAPGGKLRNITARKFSLFRKSLDATWQRYLRKAVLLHDLGRFGEANDAYSLHIARLPLRKRERLGFRNFSKIDVVLRVGVSRCWWCDLEGQRDPPRSVPWTFKIIFKCQVFEQRRGVFSCVPTVQPQCPFCWFQVGNFYEMISCDGTWYSKRGCSKLT